MVHTQLMLRNEDDMVNLETTFKHDVKRFLELYEHTNECNEITYMYAISQLEPDETPREAMARLNKEYKTLLEKLKSHV